MPPPTLSPLTEAVAAIDARTPVGSVLRSADWQRVPVALRQRAQFSARVTSLRLLQTIQDRLQGQINLQRENLDNGKQATFDRSSFIDAVRDVARDEGLGPEEPEDEGTVRDITSIPRLGLIYDMQNVMANGFARHKLDVSRGAMLLYPAYELGPSSAREPRPKEWWQRRWIEAGGDLGATGGRMVALKTDPIWTRLSTFGTPWPPFDWGSTRQLEEVDYDEAVALGLINDGELPPGPQPESFNDNLQASVKGIGSKERGFLKRYFGDQIQIKGDAAVWTGSEEEAA